MNCEHYVLVPVGGSVVKLCIPEIKLELPWWWWLVPHGPRIPGDIVDFPKPQPVPWEIDVFEGIEIDGIERGPATRDLAIVAHALAVVDRLEVDEAKELVTGTLQRAGSLLAERVGEGVTFH